MFNSLSRNLNLLISIAIAIGCYCQCVQGTVFQRSTQGANEIHLMSSQYSGENCNRICEEGKNLICYFEFTLEFYQAMGIACGRCDAGVESDCNHPQCVVGDGWKKGVMTINRRTPGPPIQVCKDDVVIVDVHNHADGTSAALHWHGIHMVNTPYMDGVPFVTQCPISYSNTFRYMFQATEPGTHFYHSHAGHHKANGQQGAMIIRQPEKAEPFRNLYDHDLPQHHIFLSDWMHVPAEMFTPGLNTVEGIFADSIVINGRGVYTDPRTQERTTIAPTIYYVEPGKRYRFRLINGLNHACPVQMQIESHKFTVIASDSFAVQPDTIDTLFSNAGERYDFILEANQIEGDFWLRARGFGACLDRRIESYALIRYNTSGSLSEGGAQLRPFPKYDELYPSLATLNHPNTTCFEGAGSKCITELLAVEEDNSLRTSTPDHKFFLAFDNYQVANEEIFDSSDFNHFANLAGNLTAVGAINNLSMIFPDYPPLTQPELIDEAHFCDNNNMPTRCAGQTLCHCVHRLKVELNSIVELIIVDETESANPINHPFHLHGYQYLVTGMGQHPDRIPMTVPLARQMDTENTLMRHSNPNAPFKDTVSIPSRGYVIIRFRANNPGFWLLHCHYEWHLAIGMGLVLQVGEPSQMVKAPKDFTKCGHYVPRLLSSTSQETVLSRIKSVVKSVLTFGKLLLGYDS